jgi:isoquinoline 1-oxidoreductase beta subunit
MFGITAALYGEITLKDGRVEQSNFDSYQILRMNEAPAVEVHIVQNRSRRADGRGRDLAIVPAVANAIFAATGKRCARCRSDPLRLKA